MDQRAGFFGGKVEIFGNILFVLQDIDELCGHLIVVRPVEVKGLRPSVRGDPPLAPGEHTVASDFPFLRFPVFHPDDENPLPVLRDPIVLGVQDGIINGVTEAAQRIDDRIDGLPPVMGEEVLHVFQKEVFRLSVLNRSSNLEK